MFVLQRSFFIVIFIFFILVNPSGTRAGTESENDRSTEENIRILDLKSALSIALNGSYELKAAQAGIDLAKQKYKQVKANYLPEMDLVFSVTKSKMSETDYSKSKLQASLAGLDISRTDDWYNTGISAKWLLFNGFQRENAVDAAAHDISVQQFGRKNVSRNLLFAVADTFFAAQLAKENTIILNADRLFFRQLLEDARVRKQVGEGSLNDELSFEVKVNNAKAELIDAEQNYTAILSKLAVLLGYNNGCLPEGTRLIQLHYEDGELFSTEKVSNLIDYAMTNRPDVLLYKSYLEKCAAEIKIAEGKLLPRIWIEGGVTGNRSENGEFDKNDFGESVAIKLSYNIFSGGADRAGILKAKAGRLVKKHEYNQLKSRICSDVTTSFQKLKSSIKTYQLYKKNADLAQKNRDLVRIEYTAGKCSLVRLNEVQRDHSMIKSREALALVKMFQAKFQLEADTGAILTVF